MHAMKLTFIFSLIAALLASAAAYTQTTQTMHGGDSSNGSDATRPKYLSRFDQKFSAADTNGDGALTRSEAESGGMHRFAEGFDRIDTNKDGKLTREEIRATIRSRFSS